jgi:hypothetical protein
MENIQEPDVNYDFSTLCLGPPTTVAGGSYFTRIMHNNNKPLYIQTPKCITRQGFVKSGKRMYTDLMFDNNDSVFIDWIEKLEAKCQDLVYIKGDNWFQTKLEKDDIETAFTSPLKIYKSGKFYLLRVNIKPNIKIYNESDKVVNVEEIGSETPLISILEIQGIKFTSRNFQIEIELKQSLVVSPDPFLDSCFIKKPTRPQMVQNQYEQKEEKEQKEQKEEKEERKEKGQKEESEQKEQKEESEQKEQKEQKEEKEQQIVNKNHEVQKEINTKPEEFSLIDVVDLDFDQDTQDNLEDLTNLAETDFDSTTVSNTLINAATTPVTKSLTKINSITPLQEVNISLDIEDLNDPEEVLNTNTLTEIDISSGLENGLESITLKKPNQVYYEIYKKAREKAKAAKKEAMLAYLEVKNIKKTYMLDDIDESDESDSEIGSNSESESESETE